MKKRLLDFWYGWIIAPLWQMKRKIVLMRDQGICRYCLEKLTDKTFTIDHVVPLSAGGTDAFGNLVACCKYCNKHKGNKPFTDDMHLEMLKMSARRYMHNGDRHRRALPDEVRIL